MPIYPYREHLPRVHPEAFLAPQTSVIGEVEIGAEASIWFGSTLRGDVLPIRIGARTSIQDNSVLHATTDWAPTLVGEDCTVGHGVILHGCTLGDRVLVGMGSIVMDAAVIGSDSMIGAGSLVTARTQIPPGVLVMGRPAKVIRPLSEKEKESLREAAAHYVKKAREYREALKGML